MNDHIVESTLTFDHRTSAHEFRLQHHALADGGIPGKRLFERWIEFIQSETREKAQAAHVDWQDGNPPWSGQTCRRKHRAVAAQDKQKLRRIRNC